MMNFFRNFFKKAKPVEKSKNRYLHAANIRALIEKKDIAGTISRKAILDLLEGNRALTGLFDAFSQELRNSVRTLDLRGVTLTKEHMRTIATLFPHISTLSLGAIPGSCELFVFTDLRHLEFTCADLDDSSFQLFGRLESLELSGNPKIVGSEFKHLPATLTELSIDGSPIHDDHIVQLQHLTKLERLTLSKNRLTGRFFDHLPPTLIELTVTESALDDSACTRLAHLKELKRLDLSHNPSIEGSTFSSLPHSLNELIAHGCPLQTESIATLKAHRRELHIFP